MNINDIEITKGIKIEKNDSFIIVDVQNDFLPGGALAVADGDVIIEGINTLSKKFTNNLVILTQDWHPHNHMSFASSYQGKQPFDLFESPGIGPVLWPDHCIQGSKGADFSSALNTDIAGFIIRKGYRKNIDSYSTFLENDKVTQTGLHALLRGLGVKRVFLCGLALDYCVYFSAIDARTFGFEVVLVMDLTKPVASPEDSVNNALTEMTHKNVVFTQSTLIS